MNRPRSITTDFRSIVQAADTASVVSRLEPATMSSQDTNIIKFSNHMATEPYVERGQTFNRLLKRGECFSTNWNKLVFKTINVTSVFRAAR